MSIEARVVTLLNHPAFEAAIQAQARELLRAHEAGPRLGSLFSTQQRWLMAHAGLARFFRGVTAHGATGISYRSFIEVVQEHALASRNTATAFLEEALHYGIVRPVSGEGPIRLRSVEPAEEVLQLLLHWHLLHLATLDALDGGSRREILAAEGVAGVMFLQPAVADGLLGSPVIRDPGATYTLFTWADEGGLLMDRMIAGMANLGAIEQMPTDITSVTALSSNLALSRTHTGRKIAAAEAMGSVGWTGRRGRSPLWISLGFRKEYALAQAAKLAIIDDAFVETGFGQGA